MAALPTCIARQVITLEQLASRGRVTLHVVTGDNKKDQRRDDDQIDYVRRYDRCAEYLDIVRQTRHAATFFDYHGDYFQLREAGSPAQPLTHGSIGLFFTGTSEEALDLSTRYENIHMLWGEPLAETAQKWPHCSNVPPIRVASCNFPFHSVRLWKTVKN